MDYKLWAPKCAKEGCSNHVGYHSKVRKIDGTISFKWKNFCEVHRTSKKVVIDDWKLETGCENKDGRYGEPCTATITHPAQLHIHHKDGNNKNNDPLNLECICGNCHSKVTVTSKHHLNSYKNQVRLNPDIFEFDA